MIKVNIKQLLKRLSLYCTANLESAAGYCVSESHYEIAVDHLLIKMLSEQQSDICLILQQLDIDIPKLEQSIRKNIKSFKTGNSSKPVFSPLLVEWIQEAWLIASIDTEESCIRSSALLLSLIDNVSRFAGDQYADIFESLKKDSVIEIFQDIASKSIESTISGDAQKEKLPSGKTEALQKFCTDFTLKAQNGEIDPVFGRDDEIRKMIDILARRRKNNPIIVGEPGVGKTAAIEGLALRICEKDVPDFLQDVSVLGLDMGLLQAGASMKGEFENRLNTVIDEIKSSVSPIILFIDEAHTLIGAGGQAGSGDAANLLKPALARGELRTIGATTWSEYKKYFEKDPALARRFQLVKLDEPSVETTSTILRGLKEMYETAHGVIIRDDAAVAAAELAKKYISGRQLPDKAVDLLDTSAARVKILLTAKPDRIESIERNIQELLREKSAIERDRVHGNTLDDTRFQELETRIDQLTQKQKEVTERWKNEQKMTHELIAARKQLFENIDDENQEKKDALQKTIDQLTDDLAEIQGNHPLVHSEVTPDIVSKVVADWTGVPLGSVMRDDAKNLIKLEENLSQRIKGQDDALTSVAKILKASKTGVKSPEQPLGIFLLVGPSGVGKTETATAVADLLFGGKNATTTINMCEFQEKHTVSRLIGSPPGYVGYGEGGVLSEGVRQKPYSVVLLDEVEKAHPEILNIFYQVFDKGVLFDGEGKEIDFKNTVIFLTSNLASDTIMQLCQKDQTIQANQLIEHIRPALNKYFKPALLARMTVIPFRPLPSDVIKDIVRLRIEKLKSRLYAVHRLKLDTTDALIDHIAQRCSDVESGARNIDHIMNGSILPMLSSELLIHMSEGEIPDSAALDISETQDISVLFNKE
jgi:type VI secretion system protein VasG